MKKIFAAIVMGLLMAGPVWGWDAEMESRVRQRNREAATQFRETVNQLRNDKADFEAKQRGDREEMERLRQENKDLRNRIQRESPVPSGIPASKLPEVAPTVPKEIATPEVAPVQQTEPPPVHPLTPIIILLILAVVCLILYFKPQLFTTASSKLQRGAAELSQLIKKKSQFIEKQEKEVSDIPLEEKKDKWVNRLINGKTSSAPKMVFGFLMLLLFIASLIMAWGLLEEKSERKLKRMFQTQNHITD
jgi:hypothetical protein